MAKIVRSTQKIFGKNAAQNQVTEFGSIKAGAPVYSQNVANIQNAAFEGGWSDALQDDCAPYRQDRNAVDLVTTSQLAYLFQDGIPEWDAGTVYYKGAVAKVITSTGAAQLYVSLIDDNTYVTSNTSGWSMFLDTGVAYAKNADVVKVTGDQIVGGVKTITSAPVLQYATANTVPFVNSLNQLVSSGIDATEFGYLNGVTSNIQTQLNAKAPSITGGASTIARSNITGNRALISNGSGKVAASSVTSTQLGYLSGVTSAIQTQLNGKVPNPSGSNASWKITCSNNFKIQGGIISTHTNDRYTVTYPTAFTNPPTVVTRYRATQGRGYEGLTVSSNTTLTVYVTSSSGNFHQNGQGVCWVAFGI